MRSRSIRWPVRSLDGTFDSGPAIPIDRTPRAPSSRDAVAVAVLLLVTAIVAWDRFRFDEWLTRTDLLTAYIPFYAYLGEELRAFRVPGWNPHQFAGIPFAGDPQSGWMYVPAMVFFTILPPLVAMKAVVAFQLAFAALSMYAFARVLGMGVVAGLVAAVVFAFGANTYHNTWCCTIWAQASTWIPVSLLGVELGLRRRSWVGRSVGWSLAGLGLSQMLAGWLGQGAYNGFLLVGGYLAYRALLSPPVGSPGAIERLRLFAVSAVAVFGLGLGLGAAGLLPRLDANQYTNLAGGLYGNLQTPGGGWAWDKIVHRVLDADDAFLSRRYYVGGTAVALALLAPLVARARHAVPFFALYTVVLLALILDRFWLHDLFYLLPRYRDLHEHTQFRVWGLLMVGPAVLAAATVDTLGRWSRRPWAILAAAVPLVAVHAVLLMMSERQAQVGRPALDAAAAVTALLGAAAILSSAPVRRRLPRLHGVTSAIPVLLLVAVLWEPVGRQLLEAGEASVPTSPKRQAIVDAVAGDDDPGGAGAFLQERQRETDQPFRYFGYDGAGLRTATTVGSTYHGRVMSPDVVALLVSARATRLGLDDVQGYNPVQLSRYVAYERALNGGIAQNYHDGNVLAAGLGSPLLDLLNVRYVVVPTAVPPGRPDLLHLSQRHPTVFANDEVRVLERESALPRAWIVHESRTLPDDDALAALAAHAVDPRRVALLPDAPPVLAAPTDPADDAVEIVRADADRISLTATTDAAGLLAMSEIYDPGWHAYVDGVRVELLRANVTFRAVPIPAGTHAVELRYEPASLRYGILISTAVALLMAVVFAVAGYRRLAPRRGSATRTGGHRPPGDPDVSSGRWPARPTASTTSRALGAGTPAP